jgi:hypothetical protein
VAGLIVTLPTVKADTSLAVEDPVKKENDILLVVQHPEPVKKKVEVNHGARKAQKRKMRF